jgi:hypothetical protein
LNPIRLKVETYPVFVELGDKSPSSGYASSAGAPAFLALSMAAAISADMTPFLRQPMRM